MYYVQWTSEKTGETIENGQWTSEKTEETIENGQYRDTSNTLGARHRMKTDKNVKTQQGKLKMPTKKPGVNPSAREG